MYGYKAFYNGKDIEVYAHSLREAKDKAVLEFYRMQGRRGKIKEHMVSVILCERPDGSTVVHSGAEF